MNNRHLTQSKLTAITGIHEISGATEMFNRQAVPQDMLRAGEEIRGLAKFDPTTVAISPQTSPY